MNTTSVSLLERVRQPSDQEAWGRFVQLYTPLIFRWAQQRGLQTSDAADLTQEVFTTLFQKLPDFVYDRHQSFRAWLRTVTLNALRDRQRRAGTRALPENAAMLHEVEAPDGRADLEAREDRQFLLNRALGILRADFEPRTWQAFWEHGILGKAAPDVARQLDMSLAAVYGAKFRVLSRLRQEMLGLIEE